MQTNEKCTTILVNVECRCTIFDILLFFFLDSIQFHDLCDNIVYSNKHAPFRYTHHSFKLYCPFNITFNKYYEEIIQRKIVFAKIGLAKVFLIINI